MAKEFWSGGCIPCIPRITTLNKSLVAEARAGLLRRNK